RTSCRRGAWPPRRWRGSAGRRKPPASAPSSSPSSTRRRPLPTEGPSGLLQERRELGMRAEAIPHPGIRREGGQERPPCRGASPGLGLQARRLEARVREVGLAALRAGEPVLRLGLAAALHEEQPERRGVLELAVLDRRRPFEVAESLAVHSRGALREGAVGE